MIFILSASLAISQPSSEASPEETGFMFVTTPESLTAAPTGECQELARYLDCVSGRRRTSSSSSTPPGAWARRSTR